MSHPIRNRLIFVLALVGLIVAALLWKWHANPAEIPCGPSHGCLDVARSGYSRFPYGSGPPVAMWGTLGYLGIAALAFARTIEGLAKYDKLLRGGVLLGAVIGMLASLSLTYAELFVIHAICKWCIASQVIIAFVFVLALIEFFARKEK
jgi:uncharacterized membrane protein